MLRLLTQTTLAKLMDFEMAQQIGADRHERTGERATYRNGYRERTLDTRLGTLELEIPKLRQGSYFPSFLEPRRLSERALAAVIQQAWVGGGLHPQDGRIGEGHGVRGHLEKPGVETAIIGQRVRLYQAVTLGAKRFPTDENGVLIKGNARHPIVEDDVVVYAGATILRRITIGSGSTIGGNIWLTRSVPPVSYIT